MIASTPLLHDYVFEKNFLKNRKQWWSVTTSIEFFAHQRKKSLEIVILHVVFKAIEFETINNISLYRAT